MILAAVLAATVVDLSSQLRRELAQHDLPALQVTVAKSSGIVAHGAAGVARIDRTMRASTSDAFHIGSCAKPLTATLAGILVDERKLTWETRVEAIFPEWNDVNPAYSDVTMADLLSHESGLPPFEEDTELATVPPADGDVVARRRAFAHFALTRPPVVRPRSAYSYSNAGYIVAAAMIERVSGKSWDELVACRIWAPLQMRSAGVGWPARVWGHEMHGSAIKAIDPRAAFRPPDYFAPAGDVHMTTDDMAKFLRAHLLAMRGKRTIISPETAAVMHTKRMRSALGFGSSTVAGIPEVGTYSGSMDTFFTVIAVSARADVAVAVSTNIAGDEAQKAVGEILRDYLVEYASPFPADAREP